MQIRLGNLNVTYCVFQGQDKGQCPFVVKLDEIRGFYQAFNICAVQVYESYKIIALTLLIICLVKVVHYMKRSLLNNCINLFRKC